MSSFVKRIRRAPQARKTATGRRRPPHLAVERLEDRLVPATFSTADLHAAAEYMVELINDARADPAGTAARLGINLNDGLPPGTISAAPKQPLAVNPLLQNATDQYLPVILANLDAINSGALNPHTGLNGTDPMQRDQQAGFNFTPPAGGQFFTAENFGQTPQLPATINTLADLEHQIDLIFGPQLFVDKTEADRGHRLNFLNPDLQEVGSGVLVASHTFHDSATGAPFTSDTALALMDFAGVSPRNPFLTGAAFNDAAGQHDGKYHLGDGLANITITAVDASGNRFQTTTLDAGGFSLEVPAGTYTVTASGAGLGGDRVFQNVTLGSQNVRLDFGPNSPLAGPALGQPMVVGPTGTLSTGQTPVVVFQPTAGAASYEVQVVNAAGNTTVFDQKGVPGGTRSVTLPGPLAPGSYQIRVVAFNSAGVAGPASVAQAFTVAAPLPGQPVVTGPTGTADGTQPPVVTFQPAAGAASYEVQVQDASGNVVFDRAGVPADQTSVTLPAALAGGSYRILVQATNAAGQPGAWSNPLAFTVGPPV